MSVFPFVYACIPWPISIVPIVPSNYHTFVRNVCTSEILHSNFMHMTERNSREREKEKKNESKQFFCCKLFFRDIATFFKHFITCINFFVFFIILCCSHQHNQTKKHIKRAKTATKKRGRRWNIEKLYLLWWVVQSAFLFFSKYKLKLQISSSQTQIRKRRMCVCV